MTPGDETRARAKRVERDLEDDLGSMKEHFEEIERQRGSTAGDSSCAVLAVAIHHYYTAFEAAIERSIRFLDGSLPEGPNWHRALIREATRPLPEVRPAIVSSEHLEDLEDILRFRHFFRHAYAVTLDWTKLQQNAERVSRVHPGVVRDIGKVKSIIASAAGSAEHE